MIDNGYLFAKDEKRLFINTSLGCMGRCKYCYLSNMGIDKIKRKNSKEVLECLDSSDYKYTSDTLITLGCFSECFDEVNKKETIKIIKHFLSNGNQVQVSTKRYVSFEDLKEILPLIRYYGQLVIFVSSSTISHYNEYERGTEELERRFKTFELIKHNIPVILYIKPVLQDVTIKDIIKYKELINENNISYVVVGSLFTEEKASETVHFSFDNKLFYNGCEDEDKIINELKDYAIIKRRSSEVMDEFKRNHKLDEIKKEVYSLLENETTGHGIAHIERVYNLSVKFAENEHADIFVTSLIALLHDVDDYKLFGQENANKLMNSKIIMEKYKINHDIQEQVLSELGKIGYKRYLSGVRPKEIEGMIVSDADMCDAIGVSGILRTYDYQKAHDKPFFDKDIFPKEEVDVDNYKLCDDSSVCHCFRKLLRLKRLMMTDSGKQEASKRHDIMVAILYHLFDEENVLDWSEYLDKFLKDLETS